MDLPMPARLPARAPSAADGDQRGASDIGAALERLAALPGMAQASEAAREACTQLRWHPALRRRTKEARAEATIRAARCSAALEGARYPVDLVRDVARGAGHFPDDASGRLALGAVRVLSQAEQLAPLLDRSPAQVLAGLHTAAAAGLLPQEALGRPRRPGEEPGDGIGEPVTAPSGAALTARVDGIIELLAAPASAPALLVAALVHAEVLSARPFLAGNGLVARALARTVIIQRGLDPMGAVVWEAAHLDAGPGYGRALIGYTTGRPEGLVAWVQHCGEAIVSGAGEGSAICDSILAGRLT
jgi:hypothetical protein